MPRRTYWPAPQPLPLSIINSFGRPSKAAIALCAAASSSKSVSADISFDSAWIVSWNRPGRFLPRFTSIAFDRYFDLKKEKIFEIFFEIFLDFFAKNLLTKQER